jgi:hypothetical protein
MPSDFELLRLEAAIGELDQPIVLLLFARDLDQGGFAKFLSIDWAVAKSIGKSMIGISTLLKDVFIRTSAKNRDNVSSRDRKSIELSANLLLEQAELNHKISIEFEFADDEIAGSVFVAFGSGPWVQLSYQDADLLGEQFISAAERSVYELMVYRNNDRSRDSLAMAKRARAVMALESSLWANESK